MAIKAVHNTHHDQALVLASPTSSPLHRPENSKPKKQEEDVQNLWLSLLEEAIAGTDNENQPPLRIHSYSPDPIDKNIVSEALTPQNKVKLPPSSMIIVYNSHKKEKEKKVEEEDVTKDFVEAFNTHIGNEENKHKARRLLTKMRQLGGLEPSAGKEIKIDIPQARMGFCYLASLNDHEFKMEALEGLHQLLKKDKFEKTTSTRLVALAIELMNSMTEELMQSENIDVQTKIAEVYSEIAYVLQRHYARKNLNAITKQLKTQLRDTALALLRLNTQRNLELSQHVKEAREGIQRLRDNRRELFDLVERFQHLITASAGAALISTTGPIFQTDVLDIFREAAKAFEDIDPSTKKAWYNALLIMKSMKMQAQTDLHKLSELQTFIGTKYKKLNWKFSNASMRILSDIVINGQTPQIRRRAFFGIQELGLTIPGISTFIDFKQLRRYSDLSPMIHFSKPQMRNPNTQIRQKCAELLIKIANESPDHFIRKNAIDLLLNRRIKETDPTILEVLDQFSENY